jgi:hypothetical protein
VYPDGVVPKCLSSGNLNFFLDVDADSSDFEQKFYQNCCTETQNCRTTVFCLHNSYLETQNSRNPSIRRKLTLASPTTGGHLVGIAHSRTNATEFVFEFEELLCARLN